MASLPLHPRLARLLLAGEEHGCLRQAALAAALLSERSPFERPSSELPAGGAPGATTRSDLEDRVLALERFARTGRAGAGLRAGGARRVLQVSDQLAGWLGKTAGTGPAATFEGDRCVSGRSGRARPGRPALVAPTAGPGDALPRSLLAAFPDRLARRRQPGSRRGVMVGGRGVRLAPESGVATAELFLCLQIDAGARGERAEAWVRMASEVEREWLGDLGPEAVTRAVETAFDAARERVVACERLRAWDLVLEEKEVPAPAEQAAEALARAAEQALDRVAFWDEDELAGFLVRLRCLRAWMPELGLPAFAPDELRPLLPGLCAGKRSFDELRRLPWLDILRGLLTPTQLSALDREAPERLPVPSGSQIRLQYAEGQPPVLAARIQELFGLAETPRIAAGRVPVLLHLLAPSGRPQQVTQDLASFWANVYPQVRKELAGRYPKHAWPTDPWTAQPERRPGRRAS
jgi:ATP-dependent helicase HrpB